MLKIKRAYEAADKSDGYRVLVDRLWPRGLRKNQFTLDEWAKELSPSNELRKRFGHDPDHWKEFRSSFRKELRASKEAVEQIRALASLARRKTVTLVYSAKDDKHNNAVVLKEVIEKVMKPKARTQRPILRNRLRFP